VYSLVLEIIAELNAFILHLNLWLVIAAQVNKGKGKEIEETRGNVSTIANKYNDDKFQHICALDYTLYV